MSYAELLPSICDIQAKVLSTTGYEKTAGFESIATEVPTRKQSVNAQRILVSDTQVRENIDDDIFFFNPDVTISRGNRIVFDSESYDVLKVTKVFGFSAVHHIEVITRITDHE